MARVLLIAPAADGTDISEPRVGYSWARSLAERHEVTVLTLRKTGHPHLQDQVPKAEVVSWDEPHLAQRAERFNSLVMPWYPFFYRRCARWIEDAQRSGRVFDVAHQPTPVGMRYPSPLSRFDIPYVLGPVGGGLDSPPAFRGEDTAPWYVGLRRIDPVRLRYDPMMRRSYRRAAVVFGIAPYVDQALEGLGIRRLETMSEVGIDAVPGEVDRSGREGPVRLLFVGRVIRTKGVRDAVRALAHLRDLQLVFDVVGEGFDLDACREEARRLGVEDRVVFHGQQPFERVTEFYRAADVFLFPSYREPGGSAPLEAMSFGLPMVVADRGGPAAAVGDCGFRIEPIEPQQYAAALAHAVRRLVTDPALRAEMGRAARARVVATGTWDARAAELSRLFEEIRLRRESPAPRS